MKKKKLIQKEKTLSLKTRFNEATSYIRESKHFIFSAIFLFIFGALIGFIYKDALAPMLNELLKELMNKTQDLNTFEMITFILQNNAQSAFLAILIGIGWGLFPIMSDIMNGVVVGYVLALSFKVAGITSWWRLLPHGIFELPAIFISFGLGIKLGFAFFMKKKYRAQEFKRRFYNSINVFLMIIIPLLILAAIIEGILIGFLK